MDIDEDGVITLKDLNIILDNWNRENDSQLLLDIIDNWGNRVVNEEILTIKITNENLYENTESSITPSFNWLNDTTNSNFSSLALTNPNEKKKVMLNLDDLGEYKISWTINNNATGNFFLVTNLYNNNYIEKINMKDINNIVINTKNIYNNRSLIQNRNALNSIADFKRKKYLLAKKDRHFLYDYFSTLDRKFIKNMTSKNKNELERNITMVNEILYKYFEENMISVTHKTQGEYSFITGIAKTKYTKTKHLSQIRKQPDLKYIKVDKNKQFNFNNLPKKIHKIKGKIRDLEVEERIRKRLSNKRYNKITNIQKNIAKRVQREDLNLNKINHIQTLTTTTGTSPMDPCSASNGDYIVTVRNATDMYIYNMNFELLFQGSTQDMFPTSSGAGDPIIMFDTFTNKWVLIEFGISNGISFCRSTTSDPREPWESWLIQTPEFPDYPKLAIYKNYYAISTNESSPRSYIIEKEDLISSDITEYVSSLYLQQYTDKNHEQIITSWDNNYENPFIIDYEPNGDYQPDWGIARAELKNNTDYVFSFTPGSYEDEVRFILTNFSSPTSYIIDRSEEVITGVEFTQNIHTGTDGEGVKVDTDILIFVADTYGDGWNGGYIKIYEKNNTSETVVFDVSGTTNYAQTSIDPVPDILKYKQINWPSLTYFGFQLVIPISTTIDIKDNEVYFIRHVDDEALGQNNNNDRLEIFTVDVPKLDETVSGDNTDIIKKTEIIVNDFTSNINGYTAFSGIPDVDGTSLDPLRELIMNFPETRKIGNNIFTVLTWISNKLDSDENVHSEVVWAILKYESDSWSLYQEGRISDSVKSYWMPSINIDDIGNISIIFSGSSPEHPPSLYFTRKKLSDANFPNPMLLKRGVSGVETNRWGDYYSLVSPSPNVVVGVGTVSSSDSYNTSVYTQKLSFPGVYLDLECDSSELDLTLKITKTQTFYNEPEPEIEEPDSEEPDSEEPDSEEPESEEPDTEPEPISGPENAIDLGLIGNSNDTIIIDTEGSTVRDTELGLYNSDGVRLAYDDDSGNTELLSKLVLYGLNPGTYFIAGCGYDTIFGSNFFEAVSNSDYVGNLSININGGSINNISSTQVLEVREVIWFSFSIEQGDEIELEPQSNIGSSPDSPIILGNLSYNNSLINFNTSNSSVYDTEIGLYNSLGEKILENDDISSENYLSSITISSLSSGTYYVALAGYNTLFNNTNFSVISDSDYVGRIILNYEGSLSNDSYVDNLMKGEVIWFSFTIIEPIDEEPEPEPDSEEPDSEEPDTSGTSADNPIIIGNLGYNTSQIKINTQNSTVSDTQIALYNSDGDIITQNDDVSGQSGLLSEIIMSNLAIGTYYVAACAYQSFFNNNFNVTSISQLTGNITTNFYGTTNMTYTRELSENQVIWFSFDILEDNSEPEPERLLIIYDQKYSSVLDPLVTLRQDQGYNVMLKELNYTNITQGNINGIYDEVKQYVDNVYNETPIKYILLVGSIEEVPTLMRDGIDESEFYSNNNQIIDKAASDISYGFIGNINYDYIQHTYNIIVGRLSPGSTLNLQDKITNIQNQINKIIKYEELNDSYINNNNTSHFNKDRLKKIIGIASNEGYGDGIDGLADNVYMRQELERYKNEMDRTYIELYDGDQGGTDADGPPTSNDLKNEINKGSPLLLYVGHADETTLSTSNFSKTHVDSLTNADKYFLGCVVGCSVGSHDENVLTLSEKLQIAQNKGSIAMFVSTVLQDWTPPMHMQRRLNTNIIESSRIMTIGELFKSAVLDPNFITGTDFWYYHILGDPCTRFVLTIPQVKNN